MIKYILLIVLSLRLVFSLFYDFIFFFFFIIIYIFFFFFFFSSRRRHTRSYGDWSRRVLFRSVPVVNPDGYAYTESSDRYWRKNRRDNGDGTFGVDLNRNWGYQWGLSSGSSGVTYSDTYR